MSEVLETTTLHFMTKGKDNTEIVLKKAAHRADELGINSIIIATCTGYTAMTALKYFDVNRHNLIAVSHVNGFTEPNVMELKEANRKQLQDNGIKVITAAHAFGGVGRGIRNKLKTFQVDEIMAYTLRMFGQGVKVGLEIAYMATDAGLVRTDEDVITIGGTARGADTAMVIKPSNSHTCLEAKVREIITKPWNP